jgi:hypothetical protein
MSELNARNRQTYILNMSKCSLRGRLRVGKLPSTTLGGGGSMRSLVSTAASTYLRWGTSRSLVSTAASTYLRWGTSRSLVSTAASTYLRWRTSRSLVSTAASTYLRWQTSRNLTRRDIGEWGGVVGYLLLESAGLSSESGHVT